MLIPVPRVALVQMILVYGTAQRTSTTTAHHVRTALGAKILMRTAGLDVLVEKIAIFVMDFVPHVPLSLNSATLAFQTLSVAHHVHVTQTTLTLSARIHVMYPTTQVLSAPCRNVRQNARHAQRAMREPTKNVHLVKLDMNSFLLLVCVHLIVRLDRL